MFQSNEEPICLKTKVDRTFDIYIHIFDSSFPQISYYELWLKIFHRTVCQLICIVVKNKNKLKYIWRIIEVQMKFFMDKSAISITHTF